MIKQLQDKKKYQSTKSISSEAIYLDLSKSINTEKKLRRKNMLIEKFVEYNGEDNVGYKMVSGCDQNQMSVLSLSLQQYYSLLKKINHRHTRSKKQRLMLNEKKRKEDKEAY